MTTTTHIVTSAAKHRTSPSIKGGPSALLLAVGLMLPFVAACSSSDDGGGGGTTSTEVIDEAKAAVAKNREGTDRALPDSAPKPEAGQNVWVISCTQVAEGCSRPAAGIKEAGETVGWEVTVFDGKASPDTFADGIRSAIADKADAVVLDGLDCVAAKGALEEARAADVKIYGIFSMDCDDPLAGGGEPLYDAQLLYQDGMTFREYTEGPYIRSVADYVIAKTDGKAKIIQFTEDDALITQHLGKGFVDRIKDCGGCEIVAEVPFTQSDFVTGKLQTKAEAALTRAPDANVVFGLHDTALILGVSQAVVASGRNDDLLVPGNEGLSPNIGFVKDNKGQDSIAGSPAIWVGWAAVDGINRMLQGEPQVDSGIGLQTLDADGPLPKVTTYYDGNIDADGNPKRDYVAHYKKIWGVS
ncbi:sugar ABC transporter substrate-binding protein [Nocardioides sp. CPCC 206347]|uniref:sugar ABC transporter substrate-binding protein n=1 Tax=unclassified Nocardioides TaxID=2615069 RepID=UPI00360BD487